MIKIMLLILLSFSNQLLSKTTNTPQTRALVNVANTLNNYKKNHYGELPSSWNILLTTEFFSPDALLLIRQDINIEHRYQFTNFKEFFESGGIKEKIVVMANQPGEEGDYGAGTSGRFLIVETLEGEIQTRKYSERQLKFILEKNGYDLMNYTISRQSNGAKNPPGKAGKNRNRLPGNVKVIPSDEPGSKTSNQKSSSDETTFNTILQAGIAAAIFGWITWYLYSQRRNKLSSKKN